MKFLGQNFFLQMPIATPKLSYICRQLIIPEIFNIHKNKIAR